MTSHLQLVGSIGIGRLKRLSCMLFNYRIWLFCLALLGCSGPGTGVKSQKAQSENGIEEFTRLFKSLPGNRIDLTVDTPVLSYAKDPAEKDLVYQDSTAGLKFTKLSIFLSPVQETTKALVELEFKTDAGNTFILHSVDLLDLVPVITQNSGLKYAEFLLKEFERFGILYYKKEGAFDWHLAKNSGEDVAEAVNRTYQAGVFNNCLDAGKWELVINSKYYAKFDSAQASPQQSQRYRILGHSWFSLSPELYRLLVKIKNPTLGFDPYIKYSELSKLAAAEAVPFSSLTKVKRPIKIPILELSHRAKRELFELDEEEMYKDWFGLVLNRDQFHTYADVLEIPVRLAKFTDKGFYRPEDAVAFDYGWMKQLDQVAMNVVEASGPERFVEIRISGAGCRYMIVLGNFDLGRLNPNKPTSIQFGINPFPKMRLQRKTPFSTGYNLGPDGKEIRPYLLLVDRSTGKWINNQDFGLEQAQISWQSIDKESLIIHMVTYERMLPIWSIHVGIDKEEKEMGKIRNAMYQPTDAGRYSVSMPTIIRKEREALRANYIGLKDSADTVSLDFESLSHADNKLLSHGFYYDEKGFMLLSGGFLTAAPFRTVGLKGFPSNGSTGLINGQADGINYLTKRDEIMNQVLNVDDNLFGLISIDVGQFNRLNESSLTFVGIKRDSSTVSQSFELNRDYIPKTLYFGPQFKEVATVRWVSHSTVFDNIKIKKNVRPF